MMMIMFPSAASRWSLLLLLLTRFTIFSSFSSVTTAFQPAVAPITSVNFKNRLARLVSSSPSSPAFIIGSSSSITRTIRTRHAMTLEIVDSTAPSILAQLDTFWQTCPYTAAALVCGVKASAADLIAQSDIFTSDTTATTTSTSVETPSYHHHHHPPSDSTSTTTTSTSSSDSSDWDVKRNLAFVVYGALYQGMVHEYVFNHLYPAWFGTGMEWQIVATKVVFNLFIQTTLVTLPVAYVLKALIMEQPNDNPGDAHGITDTDTTTTLATGYDDNTITHQHPLQLALEKYVSDIQHQGLLWKCFGLWGPVQCITFSVIPEHYRVTFMAMVSFFWLILLSNISNQTTTTTSTRSTERTTVGVADGDGDHCHCQQQQQYYQQHQHHQTASATALR